MEMSAQVIVHLSDVCRACLTRTENMKNLLQPNAEIIQLITNLASVSNLEIEINDSIPYFLCHNCEEKLKISYDFQQLVQKSHQLILACLSDTSEVKSLKLIGNSMKSDMLPQVEGNSDDFINFIGTDDFGTEIQVSYKNYVGNIPTVDNKTYIMDRQSEEQITYLEAADSLNETKYSLSDNIGTDGNLNESEVLNKSPQVEKKTANNQIMRLTQYSAEEVDKLIKKARERFFKRVNCPYCGFTASYTRSLSVHMTRLHREFKKQWCAGCNQTVDNLKEHRKVVHKDDLKCSLCGKSSTTTGHFLEHLASHSIDRKYICKICNKCFISARHLKTHYKRVHDSDRPYACQMCSKRFISTKTLKTHLKSHVKKNSCKDCNEYFNTFEDYSVHQCIINTSSSKKNDSSRREEIDDPVFDVIIEDPQNFCKECNKRVRSLEKHNKRYHSNISGNNKEGSQELLCTYCGKQFKSLAKLTIHVRTHTGEAPYKCSYCDKRTTTRFHLVVHERTHTGEKPHVCSMCGKRFSQSSVLNTHMKLHTGRPEQCSICLKRFCRRSQLRQHLRKHTGEKPYVCSHCGQEFQQKSHLDGHTRTHSTERPYQCEFCEKNFKQLGTLRSHINIHLEEKPYKCSLCSYTCRRRNRLTQHMTQHENDLPNPDRPYRCELCDHSFTTQAMFSSHYASKHVPVEESHLPREDLSEEVKIENEGILQSLEQFT